MSYDYMLARAGASGDMEAFSEAAATNIIGAVEPLKAAISKLFPSVRWEHQAAKLPSGEASSSWFGVLSSPEFHLLVEPSGFVRTFTMSHCHRSEVERVASELGLAAFDMQTMEVFGG